MENKNTRGIKKIIVGITIMFFSLFFSLLINNNRVKAAQEYYVDCEMDNHDLMCIPKATISFEYGKAVNESWDSHRYVVPISFSGNKVHYTTRSSEINIFIQKSENPLFGTTRNHCVGFYFTLAYNGMQGHRYCSEYDEPLDMTISLNNPDFIDVTTVFLCYYTLNIPFFGDHTYDVHKTYKIVVESIEPTVTFSANSNSTHKQSHSVTVTADDNNKLDHDSLMYAWSTSSIFPSTLTPSSLTKSSDTKGTKTLTTPTGASGKYYLHVEIKDFAGNTRRATTSGRFYLDNTAPTVTVSASSNWTNNSNGVSAGGTCSDPEGSGIAKCELLSNGSVVRTSTNASYVNGTITTQGVNSVQVRATDNAGNVTVSSVREVKINRIAPDVMATPDSMESGDAGGSVTITINVVDYGGGVNYIKYEWKESITMDLVKSGTVEGENSIVLKFQGRQQDETYMLVVEVKDQAGNITTETFQSYYLLSNKGPTITFQQPSGAYIKSSHGFRLAVSIKPSTRVSGMERWLLWGDAHGPLVSIDVSGPRFYMTINSNVGVGCNQFKAYSPGGTCTFDYSDGGSLLVDTLDGTDNDFSLVDGKYTVFISAVEYRGSNLYYSKETFRFTIDTSKPNLPNNPVSTRDYWVDAREAIRIDYSCNGDNTGGSGLKSCGLYNGNNLVHSGNISGTNMAMFQTYYSNLKVRAYDMAGNYRESTKGVEVMVDAVKPTANLTVSKDTWTNEDVTINSSCSDSRSGIASCNVFINGNLTTATSISAEGVYDVQTTAIDNVGNINSSVMRTVKIDKTVKAIQFDRVVTNKLRFSVTGLDPTQRSPLSNISIKINNKNYIDFSYPNSTGDIKDYVSLNYYGVYEIEVTTTDAAGNTGTFTHRIVNENPNFALDALTIGYGDSSTHTTGLQRGDSDVYFASVRNDGTNPSKIVSTSTSSLYNQFFGAGAFSTSVKYKINNDETLRSLTNNQILIPAIESGSCSNADDYVTCARIDTITLIMEDFEDAYSLRAIQKILIISLDVRPVDVSAGSGTQSVNVNVGQEYNVEPLSFTSQIGNEIVSIEETIEFNGEVVDSIDTNKIGTYTITTIATDSEGFKSLPVVRTIVIKDSIPPTISLIGEQTITIKKGQTYVDEGSLAIDNVDGEITVYGSGEVNYNKAGTYEITYQYIDSNGNVSEVVTRTIIVKPDYAKYVILALSSITVLGIAFLLIKKFNVKTSY